MEASVERIIGLLDLLDSLTEDLEDSGEELEDGADDEPSLGSRDGCPNQTSWSAGSCDDYEGPDDDLEPSLGSVAYEPNWLGHSQEHWAAGTTDDCEDEHDGREPGEDDEPALGAPERHPSLEGGWISLVAGQREVTRATSLDHTQALWSQGIDDDQEHDGREPEDFV